MENRILNLKNILIRFPFIGGVLAQLISLIILRNVFFYGNISLTLFQFVLLQSIFAFVLSALVFRLPRWFYLISFLFPFLFLLDFNLFHLSKNLYGILFVVCALTFSHTLKERVPLYLTNQTTFLALQKLVSEKQSLENKEINFLDLGSGLGGVVRALSIKNVQAFGVESAPMLWLFSSLLSLGRGKIFCKNIWQVDLKNYQVVYAFLSPAVMSKLYLKVKNEMPKGTIFISNSFAVLNIEASEIWELEDSRATKLYIYKL